MPSPKDWTPETIKSWVESFVDAHKRLPGLRDMDKGGPNVRNRRKYGGVVGVLAIAGFTAASYGMRKHHNKTSLISEVKTWADQHGPSDRQIQQADLAVAREAGMLSFHPDTIGNHFESWKQFLVEAGFAKYHWTPAECVQFARTLAERYEHGKLEKLIEKFGIDGKTPDFSDIQEHYPNIKMFMSDRVRWENWQPKKERPAKVECWVGYATLALARADGDTNYLIKEMDTMAKIGLGPAYDLTLIGELGQAKTGPANGIWLQDQAVQIHEGIKRGERPGLYAHRLSSVFLPELVDIGLL